MIEYNEYQTAIIKAKTILGSYQKLANLFGISDVAVRHWVERGRPPRTELSGKTDYASIIAAACKGQVNKEHLKPKLTKDRRKTKERRKKNIWKASEEAAEQL